MTAFLSRSSKNDEVSLTISAKTFFKVLLLIIATTVLLEVLRRALGALTLIAVAFFLALALNAPVTWVERHLPGALRGSRSLATALSFLVVIVMLGLFLAYTVPPIVRQSSTFVNQVPRLVQDLRSQSGTANRLVQRYHLQPQIDQLSSQLSGWLKQGSNTAIGAITGVLNSIVSILTILVLTFMMLVEGPTWLNALRELVPERHREHADKLRHAMYKAVKGYVNGQVMLAVIASFLVLPGLLIFHVSYPFALMAVVFICGLIPMVGHIIGAVIVTFIALFYSPFSAIGILIYYILYQQIETYLIQPRLQANTTNLSPLLVLTSLVVGISFGGLLAGLVAIPVVACIRVWVLDYLQTRHFLPVTDSPPSTSRSARDS